MVALVVLSCICASVAWAYTTGSTGSLTRSSNGEEWSAVAAIDYVSWDLSSGTETYYDWSDGYTSGESVRVSLTALSSYVDADVYWRAVVVYDPPGTNFGIYATSPQESMEFGPIDPQNGSGNEKSYNAPVDKEPLWEILTSSFV
jgi:hypothetical protein